MSTPLLGSCCAMRLILPAAISRRHSKLSSVQLRPASSSPIHLALSNQAGLLSLTFHALTTLDVPNYVCNHLSLTAANYPKLQSLHIHQLDGKSYPMTLDLQLPSLRTLNITGISTHSLPFVASLCALQCPVLNRVELSFISFDDCEAGLQLPSFCSLPENRTASLNLEQHNPSWVLDMPACEFLWLGSMELPSVFVHAPSLRYMGVYDCVPVETESLSTFTLLPDDVGPEVAASSHGTTRQGWVMPEEATGAVSEEQLQRQSDMFGKQHRLRIVHDGAPWAGSPGFEGLSRDARVDNVQDPFEY